MLPAYPAIFLLGLPQATIKNKHLRTRANIYVAYLSPSFFYYLNVRAADANRRLWHPLHVLRKPGLRRHSAQRPLPALTLFPTTWRRTLSISWTAPQDRQTIS